MLSARPHTFADAALSGGNGLPSAGEAGCLPGMEGRPAGNRTRRLTSAGAVLAAALFVGTSTGGVALAKVNAGVTPGTTAAAVQLPACAAHDRPLDRLAPGKLRGPASHAVTAHIVTRSWSVDHGKLRVAPASGAAPVVARRQAACNLIAAYNPNHFSVASIVQAGSKLALGYLTVSPRVHRLFNYAGDVESRTRPARYRHRLAWILTVSWSAPTNCPSQPVTPRNARPQTRSRNAWDYQVFAIDATDGTAPLVYVEGGPFPCGGSGHVPPGVGVPIETLSLPWQLQRVAASRLRGEVSASYQPCRSISVADGTAVRRRRPVVEVDQLRDFGPTCDTTRQSSVLLDAATANGEIPQHLIHAKVGPVDWPH